jgi:glucose/arabinose dehydrogenase
MLPDLRRRPLRFLMTATAAVAAFAGCSGGGSSAGSGSTPGGGSTPSSGLQFASGLAAATIANVSGARELAALPNGDLLVGTGGQTIYIVPAADTAGAPGAPQPFVTLSEGPAEGVAVAPGGTVYAATNTTVWRIPYKLGDRSESGATAIARVRTGSVAPNSDGDVHRTTSVAASSTTLYVGVGSSCNACVEVDPTRATVFRMGLDGSNPVNLTVRTRNPIALAVDQATGALFIGGAGQDNLPYGHPYEYVDSPTSHGKSNIDYGWPDCEENHIDYNPLGKSPAPSCASTIAPAIEFPAYSTLIGAAYYPATQSGAYAFPSSYRGGLFVTSHGSWHCCPATAPRVYFVPMNGDAPATAVNWNDPTVQSRVIVSGYGSTSNTSYRGRPTGVAVGPLGSLFVADDQSGTIMRIRPQ